MASTDVLIRLVADVTDLNKEMSSIKKQLENVENTTSKAGSTLTSTFKKVGTVIAGAFAVDKIKDFTKSMIEASASVNALDSMFEQTFKGEQAQALELISKQAQEQGIHVDRLKGTWASFYGTFRGNGADANESLQLTSRYMELAGDASAYYDLTLEDVVSRLKSITMGNFEAGDAIGININATKLNAIATEKLGKKWQDLNDTQKEFLLIDVAEGIYENSGAMGQGSREADNWANVVANLQTVWERLLGTIGQPVLKTAVGIVQNLTSKLEALVPVVQNAGQYVQQLKDWFKEHETAISIVTASLGILTAGIIAFNVWLKAGAISTGIWNSVLAVGKGVVTAFRVAMTFLNSTIGIWTVAIMGAVTVGILLYKNWDNVKAHLTKCWEAIKSSAVQVWNGIKDFLQTCWEGIRNVFITIWGRIKNHNETLLNSITICVETVWNQIKLIIETTLNIIKTIIQTGWNTIKGVINVVLSLLKGDISGAWEGIEGIINGVVNGIKSLVQIGFNYVRNTVLNISGGIKNLVSNIWNGIKNTITNSIEDAKNGVKSAIEKMKSFFNFSWSLPKIKLPHFSVSGSFSLNPLSVPKFGIDWYATGGIFTGPSVVGIGEAGDEAVLPLSNKGRMKPFAKAVAGFMPDGAGSDSEGTIIQNFNLSGMIVREEADIQRIAQELYKLQERNRRKRGVVYA
nr:MAG TPA: minor tail protein [Caudoviricetes sp.]